MRTEIDIRALIDHNRFHERTAFMRTSLIALLSILVLALASQFFTSDAGADEKDLPTPKTPADVEKLVNDLASSSLPDRQSAAKRLASMPGALCRLRPHLSNPTLNIEHHRRLQQVFDEVATASLKKRFEALAREKADAPLDLVVDLLLENRQYVGDDVWRDTMEILKPIVAKHSHKMKGPNFPLLYCDYRKCEQVIGKNVIMRDARMRLRDAPRMRLIADRVEMGILKPGSIIVLSEPLTSGMVFIQSVFLTRGGVLKAHDPDNTHAEITSCFVFTCGDFTGTSASSSLVIAGGHIFIRNVNDSVLIPKAREKSPVKWFSTERVGFTLVEKGTILSVEKVVPGTPADKCGLKNGDQINAKLGTGSLLREFESRIRRAYAGLADLEIEIARDGQRTKCVMSFCE
jgi:hypothetical protein